MPWLANGRVGLSLLHKIVPSMRPITGFCMPFMFITDCILTPMRGLTIAGHSPKHAEWFARPYGFRLPDGNES